MFKKLTGLDCLGCGMQRALWLLCKGDFKAAFFMFPAIYTTLLFFILLLMHFFDRKRSYAFLVIFFAITNASIMIISYYIKTKNYL